MGSSVTVTQGQAAPTVDSMDYLPFGELTSTDSGISTHKFTGDEHDAETSFDHTQFRQYTSQLARWMSPDPAGLAAVDPTNPQSWNRYAYVLDNPLSFIDPLGLSSACGDFPTCVIGVPSGNFGVGGLGGGVSVGGTAGGAAGGRECLKSVSIDPERGTPSQPNCGGGSTGGGNTSGSTIGPAPQPKPPKVCKLIDVLRPSVDSGFGIGLGLKAGLFSANISWWRSVVDNSTNADYSFKLLTVGAEGSSKDPTGQWNPDTTTSVNEMKYGPYRYSTDTGTWRRANTTLSKDLFKTQYGITAGFYKVQIDISKADEYITKNGCNVIELW